MSRPPLRQIEFDERLLTIVEAILKEELREMDYARVLAESLREDLETVGVER